MSNPPDSSNDADQNQGHIPETDLPLVPDQAAFSDESLLEAVLSASNDLIYVTDRGGRLLFVGAPGALAVGLDRKEMVGKTGRDLGLPAGIMDLADEVRAKVIQTCRPLSGTVVFPTVRGPRDMEYRYSPIFDRTGQVAAIVGVARDVSDYVQTARAHQEAATAQRTAAAQLSLITDAAPLLISYIDQNLSYRFANQGYRDWFERTLHDTQMIGRQVSDIIGADALDAVRPYLEAALRGERVTYSAEMPYRDGGKRFVHTELVPDIDAECGKVRGFVGVVNDITDQHEAEMRLEESEARYRSLFEQNIDAVYSFDLLGGFVSANAASERMSAYTVEELLRMSFVPLIVPEDLERTTEHFAKAVRGEPQYYQATFSHKTGRRVDLTVTNFPIVVRGAIVGVYGIARDVTAQRDAQRRLDEMALAQRAFLRDVLASVSDGTFRLCDSRADLPPRLPVVVRPDNGPEEIGLESLTLSHLRHRVRTAAGANGFAEDRVNDLLTTVGEASMNAVVHGGGGSAVVRMSDDGQVVQVWISDQGPGIATDYLHKATLQRGFSTGGIGFGHGFFLMNLADRVYLLTGRGGTTVVIEQECSQPDPVWFLGQAEQGYR